MKECLTKWKFYLWKKNACIKIMIVRNWKNNAHRRKIRSILNLYLLISYQIINDVSNTIHYIFGKNIYFNGNKSRLDNWIFRYFKTTSAFLTISNDVK